MNEEIVLRFINSLIVVIEQAEIESINNPALTKQLLLQLKISFNELKILIESD